MTYEKIDVKDETSGHENNSEYYIGSDGKYYILDSGEYKEISPSYISGASLTLTGDIGVNLYMVFSDDLCEDSDAYMMIQGPNDNAPVKYLLSDMEKDSKGRYIARCRVNAAQMGENVTFELYSGSDQKQIIWNTAKDTIYDTYTYSVNSYIETAKDRNDKLGAAAQAMQNYGAWARKYLMNENKISETTEIAEPAVISDVESSDLAAYAASKNDSFSVGGLSMSLFVESETTLRLYYSGNPIEVTATKNGMSVEVASGIKGTKNYVEIRNISARDIDTAFVFNFGDSGTIEVSALSYAYTVLKAYEENEQKADICNTVRALYKYNQAVKAYFG